jgi:hypothetical protein
MYTIMRETAAAIILQKHIRRLILQRNYQEACSAALLIQSCIRGFIARRYFSTIREQKAALVIQVLLLTSSTPTPPPHASRNQANLNQVYISVDDKLG